MVLNHQTSASCYLDKDSFFFILNTFLSELGKVELRLKPRLTHPRTRTLNNYANPSPKVSANVGTDSSTFLSLAIPKLSALAHPSHPSGGSTVS